MTNIVSFPKDKIVREDIVQSEIVKLAKQKSSKNYADSIVNEMAEAVAMVAETNGIEYTTEFSKDINFALEVLTAAIYRSFDIEHPFHHHMDERLLALADEPEKVDDIE